MKELTIGVPSNESMSISAYAQIHGGRVFDGDLPVRMQRLHRRLMGVEGKSLRAMATATRISGCHGVARGKGEDTQT